MIGWLDALMSSLGDGLIRNVGWLTVLVSLAFSAHLLLVVWVEHSRKMQSLKIELPQDIYEGFSL